MNTAIAFLIINAASTLALVGVIWVVQLVHYPTFSYVENDSFASFSTFHQNRITYIVLPLMIAEAATSIALLFVRPDVVPLWTVSIGAMLVAAIWVSTFFIQVPLHTLLTDSKDSGIIDRLVATNWIRTIAWSAKGALVIWALALCFTHEPTSP